MNQKSAEAMKYNDSPRRTQRTRRINLIRSVSSVSSVVKFFVCAALLLTAAPLAGQMTGAPNAGYRQQPGAVASSVPAPLREIGFDQHLDQRLPLDTPFYDERGQTVRLGQYFGSKPVVLAFVYYTCPMLCMQVLTATTGNEAIKHIESNPDIAIVLMDIMMPEMDGIDTMREIRKIPQLKKLPIIAVTAKAMKGDREKCIEAGASDYITKPVETDQLLSLMRVWLYR